MKKNFKTSTKTTLLSGKDIYRDSHGNIIYRNEKKGIDYRIPKNKENTFATFRSRYALALICFVFVYILFGLNLWLSIGISVAVAVFMEWRYRAFLKNLVHSNARKDRLKPVDETIELSQGALVLRIVLYFALTVLLIINTFVSDNVIGNKPIIVISYMVAILAAYIGIRYVAMAIRKSA